MSNNNFVNRIFNGSNPAGSLFNRKPLRDIGRLDRQSQTFKKSSNLLVYPEQAADQQHFVVFDIVKRRPGDNAGPSIPSRIGAGGAQGIIQGNTRFLGDGLTNLARRNVIKTIALYMPQTIAFTSTINYGDLELGNIMGNVKLVIDSIKKGRREGDVLGDIHVPHVYYFSSYVFENLMNRYGFEKVYLDTLIKSIFIYTGKKKNLINYFELCRSDLIAAEKTRKIQIFKNLIKFFIPLFFLKIIRKIRNKKINY